MKLNKKLTSLILFLFLASNAITYKLTYDYASMKALIPQVKLDAYNLIAYDHNDTNFLDLSMTGDNIDGILHDAGKTGQTDKYKSLCIVFDKELFEIIEKYHEINEKRYGPIDESLKSVPINIDKGIVNMKKLCNVQD
ncbi:hypothetical protein [Sulfurimonas sp. HSL3-7]|uniref:hypothetical protein n=1 Tax=Sulfonitrofixus jiaomeiensis TaxID=3131938 RepID=UPI0031FA0101